MLTFIHMCKDTCKKTQRAGVQLHRVTAENLHRSHFRTAGFTGNPAFGFRCACYCSGGTYVCVGVCMWWSWWIRRSWTNSCFPINAVHLEFISMEQVVSRGFPRILCSPQLCMYILHINITVKWETCRTLFISSCHLVFNHIPSHVVYPVSHNDKRHCHNYFFST